MGIREIGGVLETLVSQPEQIEAELVARQDLFIAVWPPAPVRRLVGPRRFALMTLAQAVTGDEIVEIDPGQRTLLEREVLVGPKIVDPDRPRPGLVAARLAIEEQHVGLHALRIEDTGGQPEERVDVTLVQELAPYRFPGAPF